MHVGLPHRWSQSRPRYGWAYNASCDTGSLCGHDDVGEESCRQQGAIDRRATPHNRMRHIPHRSNIVRNVVEAALAMISDFGRVGEVVQRCAPLLSVWGELRSRRTPRTRITANWKWI